MVERADVIVVGAGVAGLALALQVGRAGGASVLLIDKARVPRDKVCGEGVMPMGLTALNALGLAADDLPGQQFRGLEYWGRRAGPRLTFAPGEAGRGIRRLYLLEALESAALARPGVRWCHDEVLRPLRERGRIVGVEGRDGRYEGRIVVAADGVHSPLAAAADVPRRRLGERMAVRRHYAVAGPEKWDRVKVGLFTPYDVYLTPVGDGVVLATTMTHRAGYAAIRDDYEGFLAGTPFGPLFRNAAPVSETLGWHHPLLSVRAFQAEGMVLAGDAAGSLDPCLGMGISMALVTAGLAADSVLTALAAPDSANAALARYDASCRRLFGHYRLMDYIFRLMVVSKARSNLLMWAMRHWPVTADAILSVVAARRDWRSVPLTSLLAPTFPPTR